MNLMTAYHVTNSLHQVEIKAADWKLERDGAMFVPYRKLLMNMNRIDNLQDVLREMVENGLIEVRGTGKHRDPKTVGLTLSGRAYLENFVRGLVFVMMVPREEWLNFGIKAMERSKDPTIELTRILRDYKPKNDSIPSTTNVLANANT